MELKQNWFYTVIIITSLFIISLGGWWLFLIVKLSNKLNELNHPAFEGRLLTMLKWEGFTFITLIVVLLITLVYIFMQDHRKTKALQAFFSSLTHELKTPLASMRLQAEVLNDIIHTSQEVGNKEKLLTYTNRLISDNTKLEDQLDNHLQLSRVERKSQLNLINIDLIKFLSSEVNRLSTKERFQIESPKDAEFIIKADDYALKTIIRNLIDNTISHSKNTHKVLIKVYLQNEEILIHYNDTGAHFSGEINSLGKLFYKHNSPKGSGIGIYLIKKLMEQMRGKLEILNTKNLSFTLTFPRVRNE